MAERARTVVLPDGRRLAWEEFGDGSPLVLVHGSPGSRLFGPPDRDVARACGVRVLTVDRPGYGGSSPYPAQPLLAWPDDVRELLDELAIERAVVAGVSGGGAFALACGVRLRDRVSRIGLLSTMVPFDAQTRAGMNRSNAWGYTVARRAPWLLRPLLTLIARRARSNPDRFIDGLTKDFSAPDKRLFTDPAVRALSRADFAEAMAQGAEGWLRDARVLAAPWGFDARDLSTPVTLWHGSEDRNVPLEAVSRLAAGLPNANLHTIPGEGHFWFHAHWQDVLAQLAAPKPPCDR
jgi:pimeloyl-ACP methyl ester carboxylesterase